MIIDFQCASLSCRQRLRISEGLAGTKVKCPKCDMAMTAPHADASPLPEDPNSIDATEVLGDGTAADAIDSAQAGGVDLDRRLVDMDILLGRRADSLGLFEWETEIAHGGMGSILLCRDKTIGRPVAVKVIRPHLADSEKHRLRFLEEAQITGQLEHPNIVPIHELGKDSEDNLYFTMKLIKGQSLAEMVKGMKEAERGVGELENGSMGEKAPTRPHAHTLSLRLAQHLFENLRWDGFCALERGDPSGFEARKHNGRRVR